MIGTAADAFCFHHVAEHGGGLEGGDVAAGAGVPDRVAAVAGLVLVKNTASLTSRVRARPSSPLPSRPAVCIAVMVTPVPSIAPWSLSAAGDDGIGTSLRPAIRADHSRMPAAYAAPLASAVFSTRLTVSGIPARCSSSPAAFANGPAAAAMSFIAVSAGTGRCPPRPARHRAARGRACRRRSGTRRGGS